jgi:hypothetical protein
VYRIDSPTGDPVCLGGTGKKEFADATIPAGVSQVTYQIQAVRSTAHGPWTAFTVKFGMSSGEGATASIVETTPTRLAA